ncbi:UNVERIFIED_CONTAM: hypothetical protein Slati_1663300 [Sesamum latifolium]|uniref:SOUL heme-binding family protein n=1 Tax=Sesamum latifolium TaxID=2727402 RepID=A0AAW2XAF7_9LAMI
MEDRGITDSTIVSLVSPPFVPQTCTSKETPLTWTNIFYLLLLQLNPYPTQQPFPDPFFVLSLLSYITNQAPVNTNPIKKSTQNGHHVRKINVETPKHQVLASTDDYEIRKYSPSVIAEVTYDPAQFNSDKDGGFRILANYIGAFGKPRNAKPEKIEMTAPVITKTASEKIAMTLPVVTKSGVGGSDETVTMGFILPSNGVARDEVVAEKVEKLKACLERDGYKVAGDFVLGRYNPPWITLPPLRTNEVMIPVE